MSRSSPSNQSIGHHGIDGEPDPVLNRSQTSKSKPRILHDDADSTPSSSKKSWSAEPTGEKPSSRDGASYSESFNDNFKDHSNERAIRPDRKNGSGGFLLDPIARTPRYASNNLSESPKDAKGKRKSNELNLLVSKRRLRDSQGRRGQNLSSSPLSTEITHFSTIDGNQDDNNDKNEAGSRQSMLSNRSDMRNGREQIKPTSPQSSGSPTVGYDTDPSQIVNMAIALSEVRRRHASAKRYVSGDFGIKRNVSNAKATQSEDVQRTINRTVSSTNRQRITQSRPYQSGSPIAHPNIDTSQQTQPDIDGFISDDRTNDDYDDTTISPATATRVEKARTFFELAYEHRRLLSHLPPIRKPGSSFQQPEITQDGKIYNPLQYIRNRKLRIWDKNRINAEVEGWHDVEKVRTWIDAVIASSPNNRGDPDEVVRLPPLTKPSSDVEDSEDDSESVNNEPLKPTRTSDAGLPKPRLPSSDWETHPANLIADAFWLEQGLNKVKIQDRDYNQIYPTNTQFKFSGWRNRTPLEIPTGLQEPTPPPELQQEENIQDPPREKPELPRFTSAQQSENRSKNLRKRNILRDTTPSRAEKRSKKKGLRLLRDENDPESSSSSSKSRNQTPERGRRLISRKRQRMRLKNEEALEDARSSGSKITSGDSGRVMSPDEMSQPSSNNNSNRSSTEHSRLGNLLKREMIKSSSPLSESRTRSSIPPKEAIKHIIPLDSDQPRSSAEYDTTAPNSPVATGWPSIAINLSPPQSRSTSPVKRSLVAKLNPIRDRSQSKQTDNIDVMDFEDSNRTTTSRNGSLGPDKHTDSSATASRGASPMTRGISPFNQNRSDSIPREEQSHAAEHRDSTISRVSTKSAAPSASDPSRIRGIFKGGRIAEIVGHEVTRVGDFILKRDAPTGHRNRGSTSDASVHSRRGSETEERVKQNGNIYKTPPRVTRPSRSSTVSSTKSDHTSPTQTHTSPGSGEHPRYFNPNLPTFTSPFQRDREEQEKRQALLTSGDPSEQFLDPDHISVMAAQHRMQSRSPRLDRLGVPRINTSGPGTPDGLTHQLTYGFGNPLDLSRSRNASDKLNTALTRSQSGQVLGIKGSRSAIELSKSFSNQEKNDDQELDEPPLPMKREIIRAQALIYTTTMKAREIRRRAETPRAKVPQFLLDSLTPENRASHNSNPIQVSRRQEHVVAAQNIMSTLTSIATSFNQRLTQFNRKTAPDLHADLQTLEDRIESNVNPRIRSTADEAGELSMKLSTTSTLAVKALSDTIDSAIRQRRRGPIRWVRRLWYASIEWTVVGLLWFIWAIVICIRTLWHTLGGIFKIGRWILWLD